MIKQPTSGDRQAAEQSSQQRREPSDPGLPPTLPDGPADGGGRGSNPLSGVLAVQCRVGGANAAVLLRWMGDQGPAIDARFEVTPEEGNPKAKPPPADWWRAVEAQLPRVEPLGPPVVVKMGSNDSGWIWAVALWAGGDGTETRRVEVFLVNLADQRELQHRVRLLELSRSLIDLRSAQVQAGAAQAAAAKATSVVDALEQFNKPADCRGAAMALCNDLARRTEAERVTLGLVSGDSVRLHTISDTEHVNRRMGLARDLEAAMEECVDQDAAVVWPGDPSVPIVSRAGGEMAQKHGAKHVLTVPLRASVDDPRASLGPVGAIVIEREVDRAFADEELAMLTRVLELATPRLLDLYEHDRWFGLRWIRRMRKVGAEIVGPKHTWAKLTAIALAIALAIVTIGRGTDWVESSFVIEPVGQRVVPSPMEGYLIETNVEPGDVVEAGVTVLGRLDTAELEVERARLQARRVAALRRADVAWREGKAAERQIALAEADEVSAELDLVDFRLDRATLMAPISGVVMSGDWNKELGRPVEKGAVLYQIAPLDKYRAVMMVPDTRVFDVWPGQRGELASASRPDDRIAFEVERVHQLAEVRDQQNVFPVKVRLLGLVGDEESAEPFEPPTWVRASVEGVAKADAGRKPWLWLWTRDGVNWVRMKLWW